MFAVSVRVNDEELNTEFDFFVIVHLLAEGEFWTKLNFEALLPDRVQVTVAPDGNAITL